MSVGVNVWAWLLYIWLYYTRLFCIHCVDDKAHTVVEGKLEYSTLINKFLHELTNELFPHVTTTYMNLFPIFSSTNTVARIVTEDGINECKHGMYGIPPSTDSFLLRAAMKSKIDRSRGASTVNKKK